MKTRIFQISADDLKEAAGILKQGEVVAFPTETVYGLGGSIYSEEGLKKIFDVKGRPADNPLIVHIADKKDLEEVAEKIPPEAQKLTDAFWPGPLTLILKKKDNISPLVTAGLDTVAVRLPDNKIARSLIKALGAPIAAPSANISGRPSITRDKDLIAEFNNKVGGLIIGEDSEIGIESTVLDLTGEKPKILRPGFIDSTMIEKVLGPDSIEGVLEKEAPIRPKSPGMKYTHYSPDAEVLLVPGKKGEVVYKVNRYAKDHPGERIYFIGDIPEILFNHNVHVETVIDNRDYMKRLYSLLREADKKHFKTVLAQKPQATEPNAGLIDRLEHASSYKELN